MASNLEIVEGIVSGPDLCFCCAAMISFVNPDLLGNLATFKRVFADPISKSRDRSASPEEQQLGQERSKSAPHYVLLQGHNCVNTTCAFHAYCMKTEDVDRGCHQKDDKGMGYEQQHDYS